MTPFASVAMLEKLALLKIALCSAPASSNGSSACLCAVLSVPLEATIRPLVSSSPIFKVFPPIAFACPAQRINYADSKLRCEQHFNRVLELKSGVWLLEEVCAVNKQSLHLIVDGIA